eukprot:CAMPEP_0195066810 /NCGR_PEP_ID=MMETSP0448-20130528/12059_1 /TAXON_ID=66468 /ORGANISM="Heterocapsa triquestra, Strain CCMP 448" /LENGTH=55 /DNA_ID=CAMNT_0040098123 /DNA_START=81 /DNA_END=245 /DNA_ORIENTATION=+
MEQRRFPGPVLCSSFSAAPCLGACTRVIVRVFKGSTRLRFKGAMHWPVQIGPGVM